MKILTTKGLVDFESLDVKDVIDIGDNHRKIASEFYLDGELVRRDVAISMLRPIESVSEEGQLGG